MYTCINCGANVDELFRRYSPSVLKVLKCESCGNVADKYIEYDPVIVLIDLVLLEKPAYRHLLYNSEFNSYWKLMIVLILGEAFNKWTSYGDVPWEASAIPYRTSNYVVIEDERNFYLVLAHTALALTGFVFAVILATELRWLVQGKRPRSYKPVDLVHALTIGGCAKLLGLLGIIWQHDVPELHHILIYGYTMLCLLTAYSVVCKSGRIGSLTGLTGGLLAHNYVYNIIPGIHLSTANVTVLQSQGH